MASKVLEAQADLAAMGAQLDVPAEQTASIKHEGLDGHRLLVSRPVHALLVFFHGFLVPRLFGLEAWQVLKRMNMRGKVEIVGSASARYSLNPRARWEKMYSEGRDLGDMLSSLEKDVAQDRIAAGADFQQAVQVATAVELKVVLLANRETYQAWRANARDWTLAQRSYDDLGRHMAHDTPAPMDIGQVKGAKGKGKNGQKAKARRKAKARKTTVKRKGNAQTNDSSFPGECGYCGKWRHRSAGTRRTKEINLRPRQFKQLQQ